MASKKEKKLEKALKLAGIDKEKWDDVLELISDDEKEEEAETKEETPEVEKEVETTKDKKEDEPKKEEVPKEEEVEKDKPKTENELDIDTILEKLGIEQIKTVVSEQAKKIDELQKTIEKTSVVGAQARGNTVDDEDDEYNFENLFNKISTNKVQYNKK